MADIEMLGVLSIYDKRIDGQLAPGDNADKIQRNYQCERAIQIEVREIESYAYNRQDVDAQNNTMQTMWLCQLLILNQWLQVTSTIQIILIFKSNNELRIKVFFQSIFQRMKGKHI